MKKSLLFFTFVVILGCGKNEAPNCSITNPLTDAVIEIGDTVIISVDASDTDGYIDEVRFFVNDIGKASVNEFPYNYEWATTGMDSGDHAIKVIAYDDEQAASEADVTVHLIVPPKDISENAPPSGFFVHPTMNDTIQQGSPVILSVEASDPDEDSVNVIFYIDGAGISSDNTYPYAYTWDTRGVALGEHNLACKIIDSHGAEAFDTVNVLIVKPISSNIAPTCVISGPANNETFGIGDTVKIQVNTTDEDGTVTEVRFFVNGNGVGSDKEFPYEYDWKTGGLETGNYNLKARAIDNDGAFSEAEISLTLTVSGNVPVADFSADISTIMEGDTIRFADLTTNDPISWQWNFGDGNSSTDQNPEKIYSTAGTYTVSLEVSNTYGSDIVEKKDYIIVEEYCMGCDTSSVQDQDGNRYKTVKIGHQWWMAENLNTKHFANGEAISYYPDSTSMFLATDPGFTYYQYNEAMYGETYGALYNWWAAVDSRNICPEGWHVPLPQDWEILIHGLGGEDIAGSKLKSTGSDWRWGNEDATNESGFNGLPSGSTEGPILGFRAGYWTTVEKNEDFAYYRELSHYRSSFREYSAGKNTGFSIRCVKNE